VYRWNIDVEPRRCTLYKRFSWDDDKRKKYGELHDIYGDARGGSVFRGTLKVALLEGPEIFGLYLIDELWDRPEVKHANRLDPDICFFMDSSNVWYFGVKQGELFVFDAPFEELDNLGTVERALDEVLREYE
jgi:hypothetical protein